MVISWLFCAPLGIFIARFGHKYKWWFYFHIVCMTMACILSIVGLGVGIQMTSDDFVQVMGDGGCW